jgi:hypothetical protein
MQEILGHANDSHVAAQRLAALRSRLQQLPPAQWKRLRPGVEGVLHWHQRRLPQQRRKFLRWWDRWQKAGSEETLIALLKAAPVAVAGR